MAKTTLDQWDADFLKRCNIFDSIRAPCLSFVRQPQWPTLAQFSAQLERKNIFSHNGIKIRPVAQGGKPESFEEHYESRIYLRGELQTRLENWHDFFNAMCWLQFPKTKAALNALHYKNSKTRRLGTNRSPVENALTLFDECGAIIVADDEAIFERIRSHQWKDLFWNNAAWNNASPFGRHVKCYVFGHAMHEKALNPYIGMTAHSLMFKQDREFFQQDDAAQLSDIDQMLAEAWLNTSPANGAPGSSPLSSNNPNNKIETPKDLQAFPLLGVPGWWRGRQDEAFYLNTDYFRSKRRR